MKKFLCTFLLIAALAGSAFAGSINVGLLTQLNMTQSEFQTYIDAALSSGLWTNPGAAEPEAVKFEKFDGAETLKVAVTGDLPPIDYVAADGTPAGFNTAMLAELGKRLKVNVELVQVESGARAAALSSKRADVVFWFQVRAGEETQPDIPDGVILSDSYYDWTKYLHIRKKAK